MIVMFCGGSGAHVEDALVHCGAADVLRCAVGCAEYSSCPVLPFRARRPPSDEVLRLPIALVARRARRGQCSLVGCCTSCSGNGM